jgi:hypothetical protein
MKKKLKGLHFSSDAEAIAAAETWLDGQHSEMFLSGLQKLEFGRCSFFSFLVGLINCHHPGIMFLRNIDNRLPIYHKNGFHKHGLAFNVFARRHNVTA